MKLEGVKVIDLSMFLPGPHLTMMMADHGADVIRIEAPGGGEPARHAPYRSGGHSVWFRNTHRGKRSLRLNLKDERGREILFRLAETSDVLVEGFRPGVMQRLGLGYETLAARAPRIIYCSISAFGQTGRYHAKPAHDPAVQAMAGLASVNLGRDGRPALAGVSAADMAGSLMALAGILMALVRQRETGKGDFLDIAMNDALMAWTPHQLGAVFAEDRDPVPGDERSWGGAAFNNIYDTNDGRAIEFGGVEHKFGENVLRKAGREDLIPRLHQPYGAPQAPVRAFLDAFFGRMTLDEALAWLEDVECAYAPVRSLREAFFDPATAERGMLLRDAEGNAHVGVPIKFAREPAQPDLRLPEYGAHGTEILGGLGYAAAEIDTFARDGVI